MSTASTTGSFRTHYRRLAPATLCVFFMSGSMTAAQNRVVDGRFSGQPLDLLASESNVTTPKSASSTVREGQTAESQAVGGDTCATALSVGALPFSDLGDTCAAYDDYDEFCGYDSPGSPDLVYVYTPPVDGCLRASLCSPNTTYDTKLIVYASDAGDPNDCGPYQSGSHRMCSDDVGSDACPVDPFQSIIDKMSVAAGTTYYFVVDGYGGECGQYDLSITDCGCSSVPSNDSCASVTGATLTEGVTVSFTGDNTCATNECSVLSPPEIAGHTWESFTVPGPGKMDIALDYCGTTPTFNLVWAVMLNGCPCEGAQMLTANTFDRSSCPGTENATLYFWSVEPGTYYYPVLRNTGSHAFAEGPYTINVTGVAAAPAVCGDNIRNQASEHCDGTEDYSCPGECQADCTCPPRPTCGDNVVNRKSEECDGTDDASCPGGCQTTCTCSDIITIPTASAWGLMVMTLVLLAGARIYFSGRRAKRSDLWPLT